jgi:DNA-binding NtrC family response regulator
MARAPERLLLVEDTPSLSMVYERVLTRAGHGVTSAATLAEARAQFDLVRPRLVLLDLQLPDGDGLEFLDQLHANAPEVRVIVVTANGSINRAVQAMRAGAFDFLVKPFDDGRLLSAVQNALATAPLPPEAVVETGRTEEGFEGFIGRSAPMNEIYRMVRSIGRSTATVFITGESGTGKDVCARAIHAVSTRAARPFVPLNCAAIPRDLLESEVFGHLKGAFTGALSDKPGAAAVANGGTLFLDASLACRIM